MESASPKLVIQALNLRAGILSPQVGDETLGLFVCNRLFHSLQQLAHQQLQLQQKIKNATK